MALNLQKSSKEQYNACPYCLTQITLANNDQNTDYMFEEESPSNASPDEKPSQSKPSSCTHYFGYMNEKDHKQQMPEECLLCSQIMACMAKKKTI